MTLFAEIADSRPRALPDVREEVRTHLLQMCSTRRGSLLLAADYGVDDPTHLFHSFPGGLDEWLRHLENMVRRYEPRLRDVRVRAHLGEDLDFTLRFEIQGTLAMRGRSEAAQFTARVDPTLRWRIR